MYLHMKAHGALSCTVFEDDGRVIDVDVYVGLRRP
jgi:hypothetical protein